MRNIVVTDTTGSVEICLWNDKASFDLTVGCSALLTHLRPKKDKRYGKLCLCSSMHTTVAVSYILFLVVRYRYMLF